MNYNELQEDIRSIKSLMERSSKFISLSGLSGILAGMYALLGTLLAFLVLKNQYLNGVRTEGIQRNHQIFQLFFIAIAVLVLSILTGVLLTVRKGVKKEQSVWNPVSRNLLFSMLIPLVTGGLFILILAYKNQHTYIAPSCLIFMAWPYFRQVILRMMM